MRTALAAAGVLGALALGPAATQSAWAEPVPAPSTVLAVDLEPLSEDSDDDTAKYGLIGLSGLFGLFGYRKVQEHRASRSAPPRSTGTSGASSPSRDVDDDGSGSRRI